MADNVSFWEGLAAILGGAGSEFAERSKAGLGYKHDRSMAEFSKQATKERDEVLHGYEKTMEELKATNKLDEIGAQRAMEEALQTAHDQVWERVQNGLISEERARTEMQGRVAMLENSARRFDTIKSYEVAMKKLGAENPGMLFGDNLLDAESQGIVNDIVGLRQSYAQSGLYGAELNAALQGVINQYMTQAIADGNTPLVRKLDMMAGSDGSGLKLSESMAKKREAALAPPTRSGDSGIGNTLAEWTRGGGLKDVIGHLGIGAGLLGQGAVGLGKSIWRGNTSGFSEMPWLAPEEEEGNSAVQKSMEGVEQPMPEENNPEQQFKDEVAHRETSIVPENERGTHRKRNANGSYDIGRYHMNSNNFVRRYDANTKKPIPTWSEEAGLGFKTWEQVQRDPDLQEAIISYLFNKWSAEGLTQDEMLARWKGGPKGTPKTEKAYVGNRKPKATKSAGMY